MRAMREIKERDKVAMELYRKQYKDLCLLRQDIVLNMIRERKRK